MIRSNYWIWLLYDLKNYAVLVPASKLFVSSHERAAKVDPSFLDKQRCIKENCCGFFFLFLMNAIHIKVNQGP